MSVLQCSADDCTEPATEAMRLDRQAGHIHPCRREAAALREFCDVVQSAPVVDGECPWPPCPVIARSQQPTPLPDDPLGDTILPEPW